jgi:hypothetical protein
MTEALASKAGSANHRRDEERSFIAKLLGEGKFANQH